LLLNSDDQIKEKIKLNTEAIRLIVIVALAVASGLTTIFAKGFNRSGIEYLFVFFGLIILTVSIIVGYRLTKLVKKLIG
jgi:hypothetical protein